MEKRPLCNERKKVFEGVTRRKGKKSNKRKRKMIDEDEAQISTSESEGGGVLTRDGGGELHGMRLT